ncbi:MAG: 5-formyltetrahydrofolate cyclo-ligase, partial [Bacteroidaceae bacterium]|nr:5-formyltetrahydrofolate cyclo-ligase [Bacteroidaceae bacterium]
EVEIGLIDLIIVPGVAFDRNLNRLGRGKGYYDRLLTNSNAYFIGIGYDMQVVDSITTEPHDIKMNCIITEREIL